MEGLSLQKKYKDTIGCFIKELRDTYHNGLISVMLYGSAASGEFSRRHSNINLLVVLDNVELGNLSKISKALNKPKFRILNSLFFTRDYIRRSTDTFPIEFLDMKENYVVLEGEDVLKGIEVDIKNLRFQCEQELKAKIINIKNFYLRNKDNSAIKDILFSALTSVSHILRNLVRLKGKTPFYLKPDILRQVSEEFSIDTQSFKKILQAKNGNIKLTYREAEGLLLDFVKDLEKISDIIDGLNA